MVTPPPFSLSVYICGSLCLGIQVSACGFDSIPSDMGTEFMAQHYRELGGVCSSVEAYHSGAAPLGYAGHVTTYQAAVHGFGSVESLRSLRRQMSSKTWKHSM